MFFFWKDVGLHLLLDAVTVVFTLIVSAGEGGGESVVSVKKRGRGRGRERVETETEEKGEQAQKQLTGPLSSPLQV